MNMGPIVTALAKLALYARYPTNQDSRQTSEPTFIYLLDLKFWIDTSPIQATTHSNPEILAPSKLLYEIFILVKYIREK